MYEISLNACMNYYNVLLKIEIPCYAKVKAGQNVDITNTYNHSTRKKKH